MNQESHHPPPQTQKVQKGTEFETETKAKAKPTQEPSHNQTQTQRQFRGGIYSKAPIAQDISSQLRIPLLLMYGDNDWMAFDNVENCCEMWKEQGVDVTYRRIANAGHHLYLDNANQFHDTVKEWKDSL